MNEENQVYFIDSDQLPPAALERKHKLEQDPSFRTDYMKYLDDMEIIDSDIKDKVLKAMDEFDYDSYTAADVERALSKDTCNIEDFKALLSPAAAPYLEQMARKAENETKKHFGNTVYIFTPIYIANYCQNYCIYCGFNCYNNIHRKKLSFEEIEHEMKVIADTGMEEILILTGESRKYSDVEYIGESVKIARKYFKNIGIEIYPVNVDEYRYLHECGVDYVTVFQETYNPVKYETKASTALTGSDTPIQQQDSRGCSKYPPPVFPRPGTLLLRQSCFAPVSDGFSGVFWLLRCRFADAGQGEKGKKRRKDALTVLFALVDRWFAAVSCSATIL